MSYLDLVYRFGIAAICLGLCMLILELFLKFPIRRIIKHLILLLFVIYIFFILYVTLYFHRSQHYGFNFVPFSDIVQCLKSKQYFDYFQFILANIMLFIPFGFLYPLIFHKKFKNTVSIGAASVICIETLQVVLQRGIFDINDILYNTVGICIGYFCAHLLQTGLKMKNDI